MDTLDTGDKGDKGDTVDTVDTVVTVVTGFTGGNHKTVCIWEATLARPGRTLRGLPRGAVTRTRTRGVSQVARHRL